VPDITLEGCEQNLQGEEQEYCIDFIKNFLKWLPEDRRSAEVMLGHPWLHKNSEDYAKGDEEQTPK
jgi:serine/threonine-protein kinase SRPK3